MDYYEMTIISQGSSDSGKTFSVFDERTKIFGSSEEVKNWLKQKYDDCRIKVRRMQMYYGDSTLCGYIYEYENADWSHSPVERWVQQDWITVEKCHSECAFEEIKYEISNA
jgi:hypothetical protein